MHLNPGRRQPYQPYLPYLPYYQMNTYVKVVYLLNGTRIKSEQRLPIVIVSLGCSA